MYIKNRTVNTIFIWCFLIFGSSVGRSQSWQQVTAIDSANVYSLIDHGGAMYAITENRIFRSDDAGDSWQETAAKPNVSGIFYKLLSHGDDIFLGTYGSGVFRTSNGGQSWQSFGSGPSQISGLTILGDSLYAGTSGSGIFVIDLQNPTGWTSYNSGLFQMGVTTVSTSGNNLVAGAGLYLFMRPRGAAQWFVIDLDGTSIQREINDTYVFGNHLFVGTDRGIYKGSVDGQNFGKSDIAFFPNREIVAFTSFQSQLITGLMVFSEHWVLTSDDMGADWEVRAHEYSEIWDLHVSGNRLWAARSDGLWYIDISSWTGIGDDPAPNLPAAYQLDQNYPNPFNPATTIRYQLPAAGRVVLKIFNILGSEVATLIDENKPAGEHSVEFDAGTLPSGYYIYQIKSNGFESAKKMLLIR